MTTPPPVDLVPQIDYTNRDYASLVAQLMSNVQTPGAAGYMANWTDLSEYDLGVVMIELFSYFGDILSYYTDRVANEAFLGTAQLRQSLLNLASLLNYTPGSGIPSTVQLTIGALPGSGTLYVPALSQFSAPSVDGSNSPVIFETNSDLYITLNESLPETGTVLATQGRTIQGEVVGSSNGQVLQSFVLDQVPVIAGSVLVYINEGNGPTAWVYTEQLANYGPQDTVYTTYIDGEGNSYILFGDNISGRIPYSDAPITATYRIGGGSIGNVGALAITTVVSAPAGVVLPTTSTGFNNSAATGGTDPETNAEIKENIPAALSALYRAVTLEDYGNVCLNVTGVAKASASGLLYSSVSVYVAPIGGGAPTTTLLNRVEAYLATVQMAGSEVLLYSPTYIPVNITASIVVGPSYSQVSTQSAAQEALSALLDFDAVSFGMSLTQADVYGALIAVPGVISVDVTVLARAPATGLGDITFALNEIPAAAGVPPAVQAITATGGIPTTIGGASANVFGGLGGEVVVPSAPGAPTITTLSGTLTSFDLTLYWTPSATPVGVTYGILLDFYETGVYVGSMAIGPVMTATPAAYTALDFSGGTANQLYVHIRAYNGTQNSTDGPTTETAFP